MDDREFLGLERVNDDTWRFVVTNQLMTPGYFLFGGCALAAGVSALEEVTGRPAIYAAAHYLSYAMKDEEVTVRSTIAATGNRISQARATLYTGDKEIITVNAALGTGSISSPEPWLHMIDVPPPEECPPRQFPSNYPDSVFSFVETRIARQTPREELNGSPGSPVSALWVRIPDQKEITSATLAIFGDFLAGGVSQPMGRDTRNRSLDNTIRIANLIQTDWVLCEIHMHALANGFSHGAEYLWSREGELLGTASQSMASQFFEPAPE